MGIVSLYCVKSCTFLEACGKMCNAFIGAQIKEKKKGSFHRHRTGVVLLSKKTGFTLSGSKRLLIQFIITKTI